MLQKISLFSLSTTNDDERGELNHAGRGSGGVGVDDDVGDGYVRAVEPATERVNSDFGGSWFGKKMIGIRTVECSVGRVGLCLLGLLEGVVG